MMLMLRRRSSGGSGGGSGGGGGGYERSVETEAGGDGGCVGVEFGDRRRGRNRKWRCGFFRGDADDGMKMLRMLMSDRCEKRY